ncbi:AAA family ATPase [Bhargavaea beijingensis]|uniref:Endonuclease GajA/Old nuclease/RecF-like AAA domain-containing protein n=1 Tax=Bhargavaea beijingensis TaxID=426756 RepID=A0ABX9ZFW0_9BACL|nr:AAA family ATPase [Bhargavaea beijingensis]RSK36625.1 hypothetical protein EJA12_02435 [Bhargavaea beijingensis]
MYISEILIKNYRNFSNEPFKMELRKFTTIIGANNVGKNELTRIYWLNIKSRYHNV